MFVVLHVCLGNICRSPMAERLLAARVPADLLLSHSVGTGDWHLGEGMDRKTETQLRRLGVDPSGFAARQLHTEHIDSADLILAATAVHQAKIVGLRPNTEDRTFVYGEMERLLPKVDRAALPSGAPTVEAVEARGQTLVAELARLRGDARPQPGDDLDDPWGYGDARFARVADRINDLMTALAEILLGRAPR